MDVESDLDLFIKTELEDRLESGALCLGDPELEFVIRDELLQGSQGM